MKRRLLIIALLFAIMPLCASAGWEVAKPESAIPSEPFFQKSKQKTKTFLPKSYGNQAFPNQLPALISQPIPTVALSQPNPVYAVSVSGSLKENLERILGRYHWKVIWKAPYDYNFDGKVAGASLPSVVEKLLKPFPLKAVMYMSNRTITVIPRPNANIG